MQDVSQRAAVEYGGNCSCDTDISYFFATVSFFAAESREEITAKGYTIPAEWEAGVMNHGHYYRWYLPENHPFLFGVCVSVLAGLLAFLVSRAICASKR